MNLYIEKRHKYEFKDRGIKTQISIYCLSYLYDMMNRYIESV